MDQLLPFASWQRNFIWEFLLYFNRAQKLDLEVSDIGNISRRCLGIRKTVCLYVNFNIPRHLSQTRLLAIFKNTEVSFNFTNFTCSNNKFRFVALTINSNILSDQGYSIVLNSRHHFITVLWKINFNSYFQISFRATLFISINNKSIFVVNLTVLNTANIDDAGCVDVVAEHDLSPTFSETFSFTRTWVNLQNCGITRFPNFLRSRIASLASEIFIIFLIQDLEFNITSKVKENWRKWSDNRTYTYSHDIKNLRIIF